MRVPARNGMEALNAGLFVSPGRGRHPDRVIDSHELVFVKSGVLGISEEGESFELRSGDALLLEAGKRHFGTLDYAKDLQFYWLHFRLSGEDEKSPELPKKVALQRPERMLELLRMYLDDQESGALSARRAAALVELMLLETIEEGRKSSVSAADERVASSAENVMKARFRDAAFGAAALAKELKCNPDYLNRAFRRVTGKTLTETLRRMRVNAAAQALLDGVSNVEEAATLCGFNDRSYMRRVFKQLKGMTPKEYRALHLKMHINTR